MLHNDVRGRLYALDVVIITAPHDVAMASC
jgi:hypothetical protein